MFCLSRLNYETIGPRKLASYPKHSVRRFWCDYNNYSEVRLNRSLKEKVTSIFLILSAKTPNGMLWIQFHFQDKKIKNFDLGITFLRSDNTSRQIFRKQEEQQ